MLKKIIYVLISLVLLLGLSSYYLFVRGEKLRKERDKYEQNTSALLSDMKRIQIDSTTIATDVKVLRLTLEEYKTYRAEDALKIKRMEAELKRLQVAAKHQLEVNAPIKADVRDSIIIRDTVTIPVRTIEMNTPHLNVKGVIEDDILIGSLFLPVTLNQAVWVEPKHRFLWFKWGVKAIHQTIYTDNPHVKVKYSEYIMIQK